MNKLSKVSIAVASLLATTLVSAASLDFREDISMVVKSVLAESKSLAVLATTILAWKLSILASLTS
ncbi:hypothetical protein JCM19233_194 [Vibrio astriarenae]|nr:hypothetical protein JCM19233_194 [Vibrio sp. C7]